MSIVAETDSGEVLPEARLRTHVIELFMLLEMMDSDSEPEEITQESSKKIVTKLLEDEKQARNVVAKRRKQKRRLQIERNTEQQQQKKQSLNIERLPENLLQEVEIKINSKPSIEEEIVDDQPQQKRKEVKKVEKILETSATRFMATTVEELSKPKDKDFYRKSACLNFRDQMLFDKKRNRRSRTWRVLANNVKRQVARR